VLQKNTELEKRVMNVHSPTTTIRLRADLREPLERAVKLTRRSRSFLIMEALERHLEDVVREQTAEAPRPRRLTHLLSLAGAGVSKHNVRTREEIDAHIRWLRDNE
jgi:uncharacterized protein (DUF1778 family)